jgi:hypothetical protein
LGFAVNGWTIGRLLTVDGRIDFAAGRWMILAVRTLFFGAGLYLLVERPSFAVADLALLGGSSSFALLLGAGLLQFFYSPPPIVSGWRVRATTLERNELGYRGHPIAYSADDYVIVLVGDSNVEAQACSFDYLPESRLEHHLNKKGKKVKVFSLGAGGYGQDQELLALREYYRKYRADLVLLWQTPGNDVWNNLFPTHWPTNANPKPTFWLENGQLKGPTEQIGEDVAYSRFKILALFRSLMPSISQRDTMWEKRLPPAYKPMAEYSGPINHEWQKRWDTNTGRMRDENLAIEKTHFAIRLTPRSDRMTYGLDLTRRLLQEIERLAVAHSGRFIIFIVNNPEEKRDPEEQVYVLNGKYYRTSERQFEENVAHLQAGFKTVKVAVTLEKWKRGPADSHLNEHANDEAMMRLADVLDPIIQNR